jgi:hypothetical protein
MKVAVCFSGQPRNVARGYEYLAKNLLEVNDCDVYAHTWWADPGSVFSNNGQPLNAPVSTRYMKEIIDLYRPMGFVAGPLPKSFADKNVKSRAPYTPPVNMYGMFYSMMVSNSLILHKKYDCVVRTRFDWALKRPLQLDTFDMAHVWHPQGCAHKDGIVDHFGFSSPENMNVYCSTFHGLDGLAETDVMFTGETLLKKWLEMNDRSMQEIPEMNHPENFEILRG